MSTCDTCIHWRSIAELWEEEPASSANTDAYYSGIGKTAPEEDQRRWGHCMLIGLGLDKEAKAYTQDASEYLANLYCRSDFGCVEHQPKVPICPACGHAASSHPMLDDGGFACTQVLNGLPSCSECAAPLQEMEKVGTNDLYEALAHHAARNLGGTLDEWEIIDGTLHVRLHPKFLGPVTITFAPEEPT